jgi:hypothetical protein
MASTLYNGSPFLYFYLLPCSFVFLSFGLNAFLIPESVTSVTMYTSFTKSLCILKVRHISKCQYENISIQKSMLTHYNVKMWQTVRNYIPPFSVYVSLS